MEKPLQVFCCYARSDNRYLRMLETHLMSIERQGLIRLQADIDVSPGEEWEQKISHCLNTAQIILLLISSDFVASEYCYSKEMTRAMQRHEQQEARVIPILVRSTDWRGTPFAKLQMLPTNARPVTSTSWSKLDAAFYDVEQGIRKVAEEMTGTDTANNQSASDIQPSAQSEPVASVPNAVPVPSASSTFDMLPSLPNVSQRPKRGISRRTVVVGLIGGLAGVSAVVGGLEWLTQHSQKPQISFPSSRATTAPSPTSSSPPSGTTFYTDSGVYTLAWSPDGKRIASGANNHTVQVWDSANGGHVFIYRGHSGIVHSVAWSPDGKRIASASEDKTVQVWDAIDGGHVFIYRGHSGIVHSVAWSPDGKRIASASEDKTVQVWDAIDGGHVHTYPEASSLYDTAVTWSPDGKRIVSLDNDELIQVWDPTTGDIFYSYAPPSQPLAIALSPNGKYIACGNDLQGPTYVIDATTGDNIYTYHSSYDFIQVYALAWSPDSTCIAIGGAVAYMSNVVEVFTATTGSNIITHMGHDEQTVSVAWSPDGKRIASGGTNATVQVWDATTGNTIYIYHNRLNA